MRPEGARAGQIERQVLHTHDRFLRASDLEGLTRAAAGRKLRRLAASGELRRIRKGLYWRGPKTMFGIAPPPLDILVEHLVGDSVYGPAGVSAANSLGLTSQVSARYQVAVNRRAPQGLPTVHFVQRAGRRGRQSARLRPHEVALLEVLSDFHEVVDDPESALRRLLTLLDEGAFRRDALLVAAGTEPARVRHATEHLAAGNLEAAWTVLEESA